MQRFSYEDGGPSPRKPGRGHGHLRASSSCSSIRQAAYGERGTALYNRRHESKHRGYAVSVVNWPTMRPWPVALVALVVGALLRWFLVGWNVGLEWLVLAVLVGALVSRRPQGLDTFGRLLLLAFGGLASAGLWLVGAAMVGEYPDRWLGRAMLCGAGLVAVLLAGLAARWGRAGKLRWPLWAWSLVLGFAFLPYQSWLVVRCPTLGVPDNGTLSLAADKWRQNLAGLPGAEELPPHVVQDWRVVETYVADPCRSGWAKRPFSFRHGVPPVRVALWVGSPERDGRVQMAFYGATFERGLPWRKLDSWAKLKTNPWTGNSNF